MTASGKKQKRKSIVTPNIISQLSDALATVEIEAMKESKSTVPDGPVAPSTAATPIERKSLPTPAMDIIIDVSEAPTSIFYMIIVFSVSFFFFFSSVSFSLLFLFLLFSLF